MRKTHLSMTQMSVKRVLLATFYISLLNSDDILILPDETFSAFYSHLDPAFSPTYSLIPTSSLSIVFLTSFCSPLTFSQALYFGFNLY